MQPVLLYYCCFRRWSLAARQPAVRPNRIPPRPITANRIEETIMMVCSLPVVLEISWNICQDR